MAEQLYLIHATGWAEKSIGRLKPATTHHRAQFKPELQATLMEPDGEEVRLELLAWSEIDHIISDPQKCQSTHYWMSGTQYHIYAITSEAAEELQAISDGKRDQQAARAQAEEAADQHWAQTMGQLICPACGTVCYGDCGRSPLYR